MIFKFFGILGLLGCLTVVYLFESASDLTGPMRVFHWPAMVLTGIGPTMLMVICCDWRMLYMTFVKVWSQAPGKMQRKHEREAMLLQRLGKDFYQEGPKAFESIKTRGVTPYVHKVIERLAIRMPTPDIRELLETERDRNQARYQTCINVLGLGVRLAPSIGMLGTILGMVQLLSTLEDPTKIGSSMSLALLTTFYGLFFSLVFWTPLQQKIERKLEVEVEGYNQVIRWLEFLERRKPANYFADSAELPQAKTESRPKAASPGGQ